MGYLETNISVIGSDGFSGIQLAWFSFQVTCDPSGWFWRVPSLYERTLWRRDSIESIDRINQWDLYVAFGVIDSKIYLSQIG